MPQSPAWLTPSSRADDRLLVTFHYPVAFTVRVGNGGSPTAVTDVAFDDLGAEDLGYVEKVVAFLSEHWKGRQSPLSDNRPSAPPNDACDLCELAHYTQWYAEFAWPFRFTILDCDACDVPIAVLGEHRVDVDPPDVAFMEAALHLVAERKYTEKFPKWMFDHVMRQIPDHYHFHVRPLLW